MTSFLKTTPSYFICRDT